MKHKSNLQPVSYNQLENRQLLAADLGLVCTDLATDGFSASSLVASETVAEVDAVVDAGESSNSDVVLDWNELFGEILVEDTTSQNPGYASRSLAILNLAIYDAVAIASGAAENAFYEYDVDESNLNASVTASQAAYTVLSELYSDQQEMIDGLFEATTAQFSDTSRFASSVSVGSEIGESILAERSDDGYDTLADYEFSSGIGAFAADPLNPDLPVWGPAWGEVETFAVSSVEDLLPDGTPDISSAEYAASYAEVLELGAFDSETRTADQTEAGLFWAYDTEGLGTPMALFTDVLESIAIQEDNTFAENAALFAQASVAMADAGIVAWQTKFSEEFWRPVTAIHQGDADGNALTEGDAEWVALGAPDGGGDIVGFTPQFPTYISGHATFGGALFGAIREFYGTDDIAFDLVSEELEILLEDPELQAEYGLELDDASRSFSSLSEAMAENGRSRVYLGIHFDFDDLDGQEVGQAVAAEVAGNFTVADGSGDDDSKGRDSHDRRQSRNSDRDGSCNDSGNRDGRFAEVRRPMLDSFFADFGQRSRSRSR